MSASIIFLILLNFGISWWNAYAVGTMWVESKVAGGMMRLMAWSGAVMSASGFTWCILLVLTLFGHSIDPALVTERIQTVAIELGYVILIPGILLSGLAITFESWARAWKDRSLANLGVAGWNTYAQAHNMYHAYQDYGSAFKDVGDFFSGSSSSKSSSKDDAQAKAMLLVVGLVIVSLIAGVLLTYAIITKTAAREALPMNTHDRSYDEKRHRL